MNTPRFNSLAPIVLDARSDRLTAVSVSVGFESVSNPTGPSHEEIRHRAYSIWECAGRPPYTELEHWLKAEIEVGLERE